MIEVDQYVAWLLKLETLSVDDFRVSIVVSFGRHEDDIFDAELDEDQSNTDEESIDDESGN